MFAETQLEDKIAGVVAVDALVRSGTVVKDFEALELYEWACFEAPLTVNYSDTLGLLRSQWVKANPKGSGALQCLQACVRNWDLVNAQQV